MKTIYIRCALKKTIPVKVTVLNISKEVTIEDDEIAGFLYAFKTEEAASENGKYEFMTMTSED
jgi:hypothetical protein